MSSSASLPQEAPSGQTGRGRAAQIGLIVFAVLATVPGLYLRLSGTHAEPLVAALLYGLAVIGAAFLLSWGAEVAQRDISQAVALTLLALIAVLPEYAVDAVLAWKAAGDPAQYGPLALVNMTGANRLLIGIAWPLVVLIYCLRARKAGKPHEAVPIGKEQGVEVAYLGLATLYSFIIPLKGSLSLIDALILVALFGLYVRRILQLAHSEEPELVGPAKLLGNLPTVARRATVVVLFAVAAAVICLVAEEFADSLIAAGEDLGLDRRTLVQWLAPLASEAPELIITSLFAWRLLGAASLGALVSSKVNQWTLLVSTIPLVFNLASWRIGKSVPTILSLDSVQREDLLLTSAQSLFAVSVLLGLRLTWRDAVLLFVLFFVQFIFPATHHWIIGTYLLLAVFFMARNLPQIKALGKVVIGREDAAATRALEAGAKGDHAPHA